ncbi:MAG TPA: hypothetical protein DEG55_07435, partial [Acidaminococcaceae bacterium]|nr:hypothetical protein [Acidaminococcaceae bacterium]
MDKNNDGAAMNKADNVQQEPTCENHPDNRRLKHIEASLRTKYKHKIFNKFVQAICDYDLVCPYDKIAVCISG